MDINTYIPKGPDLSVKISEPINCIIFHFEDDVAGVETSLISWTAGAYSKDQDPSVHLFRVEAQPWSWLFRGTASTDHVTENWFEAVDWNKHITED